MGDFGVYVEVVFYVCCLLVVFVVVGYLVCDEWNGVLYFDICG